MLYTAYNLGVVGVVLGVISLVGVAYLLFKLYRK